MSEINKDHFREWVAALRSGKYQQGLSALRRVDNTFCCLGVACEIAGVPCVLSEGDHKMVTYFYGAERRTGALPAEAQEWLGIDTSNPLVNYYGGVRLLYSLNDSEHLTFPEIADLIEQTYLPEDWQARQAAK